jgi:hypothetical protein
MILLPAPVLFGLSVANSCQGSSAKLVIPSKPSSSCKPIDLSYGIRRNVTFWISFPSGFTGSFFSYNLQHDYALILYYYYYARAIAEAVSRWLPTAAARVRARVW